jgi:hypothetical protein
MIGQQLGSSRCLANSKTLKPTRENSQYSTCFRQSSCFRHSRLRSCYDAVLMKRLCGASPVDRKNHVAHEANYQKNKREHMQTNKRKCKQPNTHANEQSDIKAHTRTDRIRVPFHGFLPCAARCAPRPSSPLRVLDE